MSRKLAGALCAAAVVVGLGAGTGVASAATLQIGKPSSVAEEQPATFTFSGQTDAEAYVYAVQRPAGGAACGPTAAGDVGGQQIVDSNYQSGTFSVPAVTTYSDPGSELICAWLRNGSDTYAAASATVSIRGNRAGVRLVAPTTARPGDTVSIATRYSTEVTRELFVTYSYGGAVGDSSACGTSLRTHRDDDYGELVDGDGISGSGATNATLRFDDDDDGKVILLCAYVQEGGGDAAAEARWASYITVGTPPAPRPQTPSTSTTSTPTTTIVPTMIPPVVVPVAPPPVVLPTAQCPAAQAADAQALDHVHRTARSIKRWKRGLLKAHGRAARSRAARKLTVARANYRRAAAGRRTTIAARKAQCGR